MTTTLPPIVCGVDDAYIEPLTALLVSLVQKCPTLRGQLRAIALHHELSVSSSAQLLVLGARLGITIDQRRVPARPHSAAPVSGWVSDAVYLRLSIADALPDERIVLYLDSDIIATGDVLPLLSTGLRGQAMAAVRDPRNPLIGGGVALPGWLRLGLPPGREYFNSGVMLLDLPRCRQIGLFDRAWRFLAEHPGEVLLWDQDALNVAAADQWVRLDRRWNTFALSPLVGLPDFIHVDAEPVMPLATLLSDEDRAALIHFAGPLKPWKAGYPAGRWRDAYQEMASCAAEHIA